MSSAILHLAHVQLFSVQHPCASLFWFVARDTESLLWSYYFKWANDFNDLMILPGLLYCGERVKEGRHFRYLKEDLCLSEARSGWQEEWAWEGTRPP